MILFVLWNSKEDILKNVESGFVSTMKVNGVQNNTGHCIDKKHIYFYTEFTSCSCTWLNSNGINCKPQVTLFLPPGCQIQG